MSSTLIRGKYVICGVNDRDEVDVIVDGAVFQQDGEIIEVGKYDSIKARYTADDELGSDQQVVMPGLVNAHHAGGLSSNLMGNPDDSLERWFVPMFMGYRAADPYLVNMYCIARMIENGVTTAMHLHFPRGPGYEKSVRGTLQAYLDSGLRVAFALGARNQNHLVYQDDDGFLNSLPPGLATKLRHYLAGIRVSDEEYFALMGSLLQEHGGNASGKVRIFLGVAGPQWCSEELLIRIKSLAREYQTGIHAHMLETVYQKLYALKTLGKTFPEYLNSIGFLGPEVSFAHSVWATEQDIELYAATGTSICHNPSSNLRLVGGIAPVRKMLERGVNVALGMDNHSLNDDEDMLQDIRLCANLHRIPGEEKPGLSSGQLLKMATVNGAEVTFFSEQIGALEKGKRADIILINMEKITEPYIDPRTDIVDVVLARASGRDIDTVMIDGEIFLRDGKHTRINKAEIVAEIRESLTRELNPEETEQRKLADELNPHVLEFYRRWPMPEMKPYYTYNSL